MRNIRQVIVFIIILAFVVIGFGVASGADKNAQAPAEKTATISDAEAQALKTEAEALKKQIENLRVLAQTENARLRVAYQLLDECQRARIMAAQPPDLNVGQGK